MHHQHRAYDEIHVLNAASNIRDGTRVDIFNSSCDVNGNGNVRIRLWLKNFLRSLCAIIFLNQGIDLNVQFFFLSFVRCGRSFGMKGKQRNWREKQKKCTYKRIKARSFIVKSSLIVLLNSGKPSLHFFPLNSIHDEICIRNI